MTEIRDPGETPFARIARAAEYDQEVLARLAYEQGVALSDALLGVFTEASPAETRKRALDLATTAMVVYAGLGGGGVPLAALRTHATDCAEILEGKTAAA